MVISATQVDDECRVEISIEEETGLDAYLFRSTTRHTDRDPFGPELGPPRTLVRKLGDRDIDPRRRRMATTRFFLVFDAPLRDGTYYYQIYWEMRANRKVAPELRTAVAPFRVTIEGCRSAPRFRACPLRPPG